MSTKSGPVRKITINSVVLSLLLGFAVGETTAQAQNDTQTAIIFTNDTGLPDDEVFLNVVNPLDGTNTYGDGSNLLGQTAGTSYSLAQLMGTVAGTSLGEVPTIQLGNTAGERFDLTLGAAAPNSAENVVSGYFETTTFAATTNVNNNLDVSYVDGSGLPLSFSIDDRTTGQPVALTNQLNPNTTLGNQMGYALTNDSSIPTSASVQNTYQVTSSNGNTYAISGTTYVASPTNPTLGAGYHDWSTNVGSNLSMISTLEASNTSINIGSYTTVTGSTYIGPQDNIGYGGTAYTANAAYSPFNPTGSPSSADPNNLFLQAQNYAMSGTYETDVTKGLTPSEITALGASNPNITAGTAGIVMTGTGTSINGGGAVGQFTVFITQTELNKTTGLYGGNPQYTIMWTPTSGPDAGTTQYATQSGSNNLVDRIVGDLAAATQWGWSTATDTVAAHAISTGTTAALVGTVFDPNYTGSGNLSGLKINQLSTGQYFYLLSLEGNAQQDWSGAGIDPSDPLLYSNYVSDVAGKTQAYTSPYTDRLLAFSPDTFYTPGSNPANVNTLYIDVTLGPSGAYTVNELTSQVTGVPEPGTWALLGLGLGVLLVVSRCRKV